MPEDSLPLIIFSFNTLISFSNSRFLSMSFFIFENSSSDGALRSERIAASVSCSERAFSKAVFPVTASIRRTPDAIPPSDRIRNKPMSPVAET